MQKFQEMPYGYRWQTEAEMEEYYATDDKSYGWMNDRYVGLIPGSGLIRQWDCMVEFGLDHDHDAEECERTMFLMNAASEDAGYYADYEMDNGQDAHYERFGRPAFPNEY